MNNKTATENEPTANRKKSPFKKALRIISWSVASVIAFIAIAITCALLYLTPARLTPLATSLANKYLNANVDASRIELYFWSTFPRFEIQVDSLNINSLAFASLPDSSLQKLPTFADSLMSLEHLRGNINVPALIFGKIRLHDIELYNPVVNIVQYNGEYANYDIAKPSESEPDTTALSLPDIEIHRFVIIGKTPIRYVSVADSINIKATLDGTDLTGEPAPQYKLSIDGNANGYIEKLLKLNGLTFGANGNIEWDSSEPLKAIIDDFTVNIDGIAATFDSEVDFSDAPTISSFALKAHEIKISDIASTATSTGLASLESLSTDLSADLDVTLLTPWRIDSTIPEIELKLNIPRGTLSYEQLQLDRFSANISAILPKGDPNLASVTINDLTAVGPGVGFTLKATATADGNLTDLLINGNFKGGLAFERLPQAIMRQLPFILKGRLTGETTFRFRPANLTELDFHKLKADGEVRLSNFHFTALDSTGTGTTTAYSHNALLRFGTNSKVRGSESVVDSMLTVRLDIDTAHMSSGGVNLSTKRLHAGIGAKNNSRLLDSTRITPIGATIGAQRFTMTSDTDTMRIRLRDINASASLTRYRNNAKLPLLNLGINSKFLRYSDRLNRANLREAAIKISLHPRKRPRLSRRASRIYDSLSYVLPNLTPDSILSLTEREMAKRPRKSHRAANDTLTRSKSGKENIDFGVDNSIQSWLKLWNAEGSVTAKRARAFTPYFPVSNRISNLDLTFNTDSVELRNLDYQADKTKLNITGAITNITSAVTSRRGAPIGIRLSVKADTLDVNAFADAAFAGAAFAAREDSTKVSISDSESEEELQKSIEAAAGADKLAFVVPSNVAALLEISANEVLYADVWFQKFTGRIEMSDGAIHLDRLAGYTEMGTIDITGLYSAPTLHDINFAAGLVIRRLDLKKFLHMIPQIDTILPLLRHVQGYITADMALTTELDSVMNLKFNTLKAAVRLDGDSLVLLDNKTFSKISKWLLFKKKDRNLIDHMDVSLQVADSRLDVYPFIFQLDRYKLGIWGNNDLDMNYDYHIAVLKSIIPFKFGVTVKGHGDHFKIRLGRANFNPDRVASSRLITDTTRINLLQEIRNVFKFGVHQGKTNKRLVLQTQGSLAGNAGEYGVSDNLTHADSVLFMQEGVIPMTKEVADSLEQLRIQQLEAEGKIKPSKKEKKKRK